MFSQVKSVGCRFFCFLILVLSASWLSVVAVSGLQFVGAKNSESCLIKAQSFVSRIKRLSFKV
ncbi:hypothetical protein FORC37_p045 (plasmid) [Vibrio vulnificus]|nr:hypothetical protein FORC37_p045 [Vibrio vulnificus]